MYIITVGIISILGRMRPVHYTYVVYVTPIQLKKFNISRVKDSSKNPFRYSKFCKVLKFLKSLQVTVVKDCFTTIIYRAREKKKKVNV